MPVTAKSPSPAASKMQYEVAHSRQSLATWEPNKYQQTREYRSGHVTPISDSSGWHRTDQKIAHDAARAGRGKGENEHPENIKTPLDSDNRAAERKHKCTD